MKRLKFIVEQGGETKAEADKVCYVFRLHDRLYRLAPGGDVPEDAEEWWIAECAPSGWESFPIWPGTEPDEIEVRARLEVSSGGALELYMNDAHAAWLVSGESASLGITEAIDERLREIREGKP